ncbi:YraN family protein [Pontibacter sp. SGAir0037]|uniref:YraN family protein n=1 Tax=Pontibacter sp. SGAir0037 TaxID=2571030 RepID=UPI0010CCB710|nr:YraN family protein [Pontibacter sp. SGAir0037]QCR25161.1 YraN family protein [Pontibacter sp. SGAir0037]
MTSQKGEHIRTGQSGERQAAVYLQQKQYTIRHRNYKYKRAEIDLIAQKDDTLVFVEVKTRATDKFGFPEEAVNWKKEKQILKAAEQYIQAVSWEQDIRFDIISITLTEPVTIHHIEDAFH